MVACSEGEEQQEGHHETEEAHGLRQGKSQDGIGEKLLLQRWVAGVANDQTAEHASNTSSCNEKLGKRSLHNEPHSRAGQ